MKDIEHLLKKIIGFIRKPIVIIAFIIIVSSSLWFINSGKDSSGIEYITVQRGDLVQEIIVTGRVNPSQSVDLAFEKSGRVSWINTSVGNRVFVGQILVQLENGDIAAKLSQAKANVKEQQAKLDELNVGSRPEEIQVQQVKVDNAKISLQDAKQTLVDALNQVYSKSDDAIRNKTDQLFSNPKSDNPKIISIVIIGSVLRNNLERDRLSIRETLNQWKESLEGLTIDSSFETFIDEGRRNLSQIKEFLADIGLAISDIFPHSTLTQVTIDGWRVDVSSARTNVNTATATVTSAVEKFQDANSSLALAIQELSLTKAGATPEQILAQEAKVEQVQATVNQYQAELLKTLIRAPISGIVTSQEAKVGEIVAASAIIVSLISENQFEIEANIPEADISKISVGDTAVFTLDAFGPDIVFNATVTKVNPAETVIEGVSTYEIALQFENNEQDVKSGMTADVNILADKKDGVLSVPGRSVITREGGKIVRIVKDNEEIEEREVVTGMRGSDGSVEIIEGIEEGEKVIVFIKE